MTTTTRTDRRPDLASVITAGWAELARTWLDWLESSSSPAEARHEQDLDCCDPCRRCDPCRCCDPEADVVVHARPGERRIVPVRLHNRWRRERPVTVEVGPWHVCHGAGLAVRAAADREQFTMAPCETVVVRLVLDLDSKPAGETPAGSIDEECVSGYADVRFEGCARPLRVAVVVRPSACGPVDVTCDCGCC